MRTTRWTSCRWTPRRHDRPLARRTRTQLLLLALSAVLLLPACSPRTMLVREAADALATQGAASEDDIGLAREASAFYLKLSESLLREQPAHLALASAVASGFTRYAYAFVAFEADRIEPRDARAAGALRQRAARLYRRASGHALAALEADTPGFRAALAAADPGRWPRLRQDQVDAAYWAATAWGAAIALSKDEPDAVADLPQAHRLARLAYEAAPAHAQGGLASLMGSFEAARPGGSLKDAARYFDAAVAHGGGRQAAVFVARAEGLALPAADRTTFDVLLRQAVVTAQLHRDLGNALMRERAEWLLSRADDLF